MSDEKREGDPTARSIVQDFLIHEAARSHERTDWYLIFHAILFEAFFAKDHPSAVVGSVGFIASFLWVMTGFRQSWLMMHLGRCMASAAIMGPDVSWTFNQIFAARDEGLSAWPWRAVKWARPVPVFCVVTPVIFLVAWAILLERYFFGN